MEIIHCFTSDGVGVMLAHICAEIILSKLDCDGIFLFIFGRLQKTVEIKRPEFIPL